VVSHAGWPRHAAIARWPTGDLGHNPSGQTSARNVDGRRRTEGTPGAAGSSQARP
jgi:hypothetical protein